ncbi:MAG: nuclear transport factor 2 family protein [Gammaproteobacteria bacterium]|nr:nuclear transport factor 2 family protein [Gammaproteobacteria bacterium]NNF59733.1 nuclear transport factor 2 family protein [Gammaproteobacteria bacterium]
MTITPKHNWLHSLFASIDRMDADAFAGFLTEDGRFTFGNQPPAIGRAAVRDAVKGFFASIAGVRHRIDRVWEDEDSIVCHGEVTYEKMDGSSITLPFADVFYLQGELISDYRIYMDVTPLYAESG